MALAVLAGCGAAASPGPTAGPAGSDPVPAASASPSPTAVPAPMTGLHARGSAIVDTAGREVQVLGVNRSGTEYRCVQGTSVFDGPSDQSSVEAMASWGITAVRVPLNEDCWLGINGVPERFGGRAYQQAVDDYVRLLTDHGLAVILTLQWAAAGSAPARGIVPMPDADHAPAFWASVAGAYGRNGSIVFDLYTEPHDVSWDCWLTGRCPEVGYPVAGMQRLVDAVRAAGATNLLLAGGLAYANDLSGWLAHRPTDPRGNIAASWHVYDFNACATVACAEQTVAPVTATVPVVAGEIGEKDCAHGHLDALMPWLDRHASGYLAWAWDTYGCAAFPALVSDYSGTPTAYGVGLRDHFRTLAGRRAHGG